MIERGSGFRLTENRIAYRAVFNSHFGIDAVCGCRLHRFNVLEFIGIFAVCISAYARINTESLAETRCRTGICERIAVGVRSDVFVLCSQDRVSGYLIAERHVIGNFFRAFEPACERLSVNAAGFYDGKSTVIVFTRAFKDNAVLGAFERNGVFARRILCVYVGCGGDICICTEPACEIITFRFGSFGRSRVAAFIDVLCA